MTIRLTKEKCDSIVELCNSLISRRRATVKELSRIIGKLVAASPGVTHEPLYIKPLERIKDKELKIHKGNFNGFFTVTPDVKILLQWWIDNIFSSYKIISTRDPDIIMYTDSSKRMWGAYGETNNKKTNGFWSSKEQEEHINVLELRACQL